MDSVEPSPTWRFHYYVIGGRTARPPPRLPPFDQGGRFTVSMNRINAAPLRVKIFSWIILGALSVFFAEVLSGSSPFPWFTIWGLFVTFPLYGLHAIVLAFLVFRPGRRITLPALFLAGMIFGMYEAYITKVLFDPTWGAQSLTLGGLYVFQTVVLVLFWHPFMAFIAPLLATECLITESREIPDALPPFLRGTSKSRARAVLSSGVAAVLLVPTAAINAPTPLRALESILSSIIVISVLWGLWRLLLRGKGYALRDLLPNPRQAAWLGGALLCLYLVLGFIIRRGSLPKTLGPHVTVAVIYAVLAGLLFLVLRWGAIEGLPTEKPDRAVPWPGLAVFCVIIVTGAAIVASFKAADTVAVLVSWAIGCCAGLSLLGLGVVRVLRNALRRTS